MNLLDFLHLAFVQRALAAAALISLGCGIIGTLALYSRTLALVGGIAHAAYGGLGLALFFSLPLLPTTLAFALVCALIIAALSRRQSERKDAAIAVIWAAGMSLGLLLSDLVPGSNGAVMNYLFGAILAVSEADLYAAAGADLLFVVFVFIFGRQLVSLCIDPAYAASTGIKEAWLSYALAALSALCIIIGLRAVGVMLIVALLSIPPYIASMFCLKMSSTMVVSCLLSLLFCFGGIGLCLMFDLSASACIIMLASAGFLLAILIKKINFIIKKRA